LVEGPTLADRIEEGALPADEALGIAMQIAQALEGAHGQGIVHRDLKPANIKLRPDGTVKVLDFGIAKALAPDLLTSAPQSPMLTTPMTLAGVILGTAAYMSPEQARGKPVDQRADIWAFGCVLYEMLTGQPVFGGEDVTITLARVLERDTDFDSLPAAISPAVRQTLMLCLQKDVRKRVADIRDVRLALEGAFESVSPRVAEAAAADLPVWRQVIPMGAAVLVTGLVVGFIAWSLWPTPEPEPEPPYLTRFDYDLPEDQAFRNTGWPLMALSPDGRHFAYNTQDGLYLRTMDELEARLIPGTEPILDTVTFSPDGQSLAYWDVSNQLKRIAISGGAPVVICELSDVSSVSWESDGTILYSASTGILRVSANGGTPELVIPTVDGEFFYGPRLLPDGDSVLFSVTSTQTQGWDDARIVAQSLSTGERIVLVEGGSDARYLPPGHLVYALGDGLFAVAFDPDSLTVFGGAVPLVQGVMRASAGQTGVANYGVSNDGTLVYVTGSVTPDTRTLLWVDRDGHEEPIDVPPRTYVKPRISPDGTKVALDVRDQDFDIWIWDLGRETLTRLTFDPGQDEFPVWSPDGQQIAFSVTGGGGPAATSNTSLFWRAADGTGSAERLAESSGQMFPTSFLPDAAGILVYGTVTTDQGDDIAIVRLEGEDRATPLLETTFEESYPALSPDGRWLAYVSDESGNNEIFVRPCPDIVAGRWQVSTGGGTQPFWARDGRELFYRNGEAVITVPIQTDPSFTVGNPEVMFEGDYIIEQGGPNYDVSPDGERFLMIKQIEDASATSQIIVVQNWFEELKRLAPPAEQSE
ncbi:MAG: protein kinase, partial [Gammaproteobacteria bacterium]